MKLQFCAKDSFSLLVILLARIPQPLNLADDADCLRLVSGFCDRDLNHILLDRLDQINISQHIGKDNIITEGECLE